MPRTSPVIVTAPDGTEYRFPSCKAAGALVGASGSNVSQQCVMGSPIHGYRVRYERMNRMGQLMEVDNADCPMCCDYCPVVDVPGVCRFEEREDTNEQS